MIDPGHLDARIFIEWRLSCLRAAQDGVDPPPMPYPDRPEAATEGEDGAPHRSDALRWIIKQLEGIEHAQGQD